MKEICKTIMVLAAWAFPIVLAAKFDDLWMLFFFLVSAVLTSGIFTHYEELAKYDSAWESLYESEDSCNDEE